MRNTRAMEGVVSDASLFKPQSTRLQTSTRLSYAASSTSMFDPKNRLTVVSLSTLPILGSQHMSIGANSFLSILINGTTDARMRERIYPEKIIFNFSKFLQECPLERMVLQCLLVASHDPSQSATLVAGAISVYLGQYHSFNVFVEVHNALSAVPDVIVAFFDVNTGGNITDLTETHVVVIERMLKKQRATILDLCHMCRNGKCIQYYMDIQQCHMFSVWVALLWLNMGRPFPSHTGAFKLVVDATYVSPSKFGRSPDAANAFFQLVMFALYGVLARRFASQPNVQAIAASKARNAIIASEAIAQQLKSLHGLPAFPWHEGFNSHSHQFAQDNSAWDRMPFGSRAHRMSVSGGARRTHLVGAS